MKKKKKDLLESNVEFAQEQKYLVLKNFFIYTLVNFFISYPMMIFLNILNFKGQKNIDINLVLQFNILNYIISLFFIEILIIISMGIQYINKYLNATRNYGQHGKGILQFLDGYKYENKYDRNKIETYPTLKNFDIHNLDENNHRGFVVGSKSENVMVIDSETGNNIYVEGGTGSFKTWAFLIPTIFSLSIPLKNVQQENICIPDPKKQLIKLLYNYFKTIGYEIIIVDTIDPMYSSNFNPLETIYKIHQKINVVKLKAKNEKREITKKEKLLVFELESEKNNYISSTCEILTADPTAKEKFWTVSAKELLTAFIHFTLYALDNYNKINDESFVKSFFLDTEKNNNVFNEIDLQILTEALIKYNSKNNYTQLNITSMLMFINYLMSTDQLDDLINELPMTHPARLHYSIISGTKGETRGSILVTLISSLSILFDESVASLTSKSTINFDDIDNSEKPVVFFLAVPDEDKSRHFLTSLFIEQLYTSLRKQARKNKDGKLKRRFDFLLEEAPNICDILNYSEKLSVARESNIRFANLCQAKSQYIRKYGKDVTNSILENCHIKMTLLTSNNDRIKEIQELSGEKTIVMENTTYKGSTSFINTRYSSILEKKVLTYNQIRELQPTECILDMIRHPMIKATLVPAFTFLDLDPLDDTRDVISVDENVVNLEDLNVFNNETTLRETGLSID